ncbi:MAG: L,D-transpeptidase family protein [Actinophytocola sp.]|nr:L,D-transpeptidase family protein [Actinophytocola sp.]
MLTGVLLVALGLVAVMVLAASGHTITGTPTTTSHQKKQVTLSSLVESTTHTRLDRAPRDPNPQQATEGWIVRPTKVIALRDAPGGRPFGKVGPKQIGETWLPVIAQRGQWTQVLLPSKPNGSTGWLRSAHVERTQTPYLIRVHLSSMTLELSYHGREMNSWTIGIGKPDTPTPIGRTFILGSIVDPNQTYSPIILPLGSHSETLDSFGGGPGTVAIHTWPTTDVLGTASSNGCIRVSQEALNQLTRVPLGTLVLVDQQ